MLRIWSAEERDGSTTTVLGAIGLDAEQELIFTYVQSNDSDSESYRLAFRMEGQVINSYSRVPDEERGEMEEVPGDAGEQQPAPPTTGFGIPTEVVLAHYTGFINTAKPFQIDFHSILCAELPDEDCPICLEPMGGEDGCVKLQCGHHYCIPCIAEWTGNRNANCPECRTILYAHAYAPPPAEEGPPAAEPELQPGMVLPMPSPAVIQQMFEEAEVRMRIARDQGDIPT